MTAADRERRAYFRRELREYEKVTEMTDEEKAAIREWVADGNSVHYNPSCCVYEGGKPVDFMDSYRQEEEMRRETEVGSVPEGACWIWAEHRCRQ